VLRRSNRGTFLQCEFDGQCTGSHQDLQKTFFALETFYFFARNF